MMNGERHGGVSRLGGTAAFAVCIGGADETGEVVSWRGVRVPLGVWITPSTPVREG